jgi:hypothetical protein
MQTWLTNSALSNLQLHPRSDRFNDPFIRRRRRRHLCRRRALRRWRGCASFSRRGSPRPAPSLPGLGPVQRRRRRSSSRRSCEPIRRPRQTPLLLLLMRRRTPLLLQSPDSFPSYAPPPPLPSLPAASPVALASVFVQADPPPRVDHPPSPPASLWRFLGAAPSTISSMTHSSFDILRIPTESSEDIFDCCQMCIGAFSQAAFRNFTENFLCSTGERAGHPIMVPIDDDRFCFEGKVSQNGRNIPHSGVLWGQYSWLWGIRPEGSICTSDQILVFFCLFDLIFSANSPSTGLSTEPDPSLHMFAGTAAAAAPS